MPFSREYARSRTAVWIASGRFTLHFCARQSTSDGWIGSGWKRPYSPPYQQRHMITGGPGGWGGATILSGVRTNPHTGNPAWCTQVVMRQLSVDSVFLSESDPEVAKTWYTEGDPWDSDNPTYIPPSESIFVEWQSVLPVREWAYEAFNPGTLRPSWAGGAYLSLRNKPTSNVSTAVTFNGGSDTFTQVPSTNMQHYLGTLPDTRGGVFGPNEDFSNPDDEPISSYALYITAAWNAPFNDGTYNDLPYPDALFAEATGLAFDGAHSWVGSDGGGFDADPNGAPQPASIFRFVADGPSPASPPNSVNSRSVWSVPRWDVAVTGAIRDWNGTLPGVPVSFGGDPTVGFPGTRPVNGSVWPLIDAAYLTGNGFEAGDTEAATIQEGEAWNALSLDRAAALTVEEFIAPPVAWTAADCTATVAGSELVCAATGANPSISRELRNDFNDIDPITGDGPTVWFAAHSAEVPAWVNDWRAGDTGGPTLTLDGPGEWVRIGRRLRPTSDVFNWSSYRYARLTAKADAACDVTLKVSWDDLVFAPTADPSLEGWSVQRVPRSATYTVSLTTSLAAHEIDLPSIPDNETEALVGHTGLRCVRSVEYAFPSGRTVTFRNLELFEKERPSIDVHRTGIGDSGDDLAMIGARSDGKSSLFLTPRDNFGVGGYPHSIWGWPVKGKTLTSEAFGYSLLTSQLAAEISLQEGWTAAALDGPDEGSPSYAVWLEERFETPIPVGGLTLTAKRSYGGYAAYPRSGYAVGVEATLGSAVHGLVFDPDTHEPVSTPVVLEEIPAGAPFADPATIPLGEQVDGTTSTGDGRFRMEAREIGPYECRSSPGTPDQLIHPGPVPMGFGLYELLGEFLVSRTWWCPAFGGTGQSDPGGGPVVLDVDRLGNRWITFARDGQVMLARQLGAASAWEEFEVGAAGADPWIHLDETDPLAPVRIVFCWEGGTIYEAVNREGGHGKWRLKLIATGTHPFIRKDKGSGLTFYLYWRGNTIYLKRSQDDGATFLEGEVTVLSGVSEQTATMDFKRDALHTLLVVYTDGSGDIQQVKSEDNGLTWS